MQVRPLRIKIGAEGDRLPMIGFVFFLLLPMPFSGISTTLSGAVLLGALICLANILRNRYCFDKYMLFVFVFFFLGELLALLICTNMSKTFSFSIQKSIVVLVIYPIMLFFLTDADRLTQGITAYRYGCLFVAVLALVAYLFRVSIPFVATKYSTGRLIIAGLGPNVIARLFCIGALIVLYHAQIIDGKKKVFLYLEYAVITLAVFATVSSSGIILLLLGSVLIYLRFNEGVRRLSILKVVVAGLCIVVLLLIVYRRVPLFQSLVQKLFLREMTNQMMDAEDGGYSLHGRFEGLKSFGQNAIKHFLVGVGYGCSSVINGRTIHFPILASLLETGVLGFVSCLYLYSYPIYADIRILKSDTYAFYGIVSLVIVLGDMIQPNPNYAFTWFAIFLGICAYRCFRADQIEE